MENNLSVQKILFEEMIDLFERTSLQQFMLKPGFGDGQVDVFELEKGLQARKWNCRFNEGIEMLQKPGAGYYSKYYTLAFFPDMQGLKLTDEMGSLLNTTVWDTIFLSDTSNVAVLLSPQITNCCLSISFSAKWLHTNLLQDNAAFGNIIEKIGLKPAFSLFDSMTSTERQLVHEVLDISWRNSLGTFYIKSAVLNLIYQFFHKIKDQELLQIKSVHLDSLVREVEKYLSNHVAGKLPNLKVLAKHYSISESTLKRHFIKRYGLPMSAYFASKKIEYALLSAGENLGDAYAGLN